MPIVHDDGNRQLIVDTFAEARGRTGWQVFAWVLMDNHYHAVFRTPEANLVAGMQWFQNAYTRRLNARRHFWGHLFGGRYKATPVEDEATSPRGSLVWRDYLRTVIDYVHLNPGRAGIVDGVTRSLLDYPWSSISAGYGLPPSKRPGGMAVTEGLDLLGESDTTAGRRRFVERLDGFITEEGGDPVVDEAPLSELFERSWYWGSQEFSERLQKRLEGLGQRNSRKYRSRSSGPVRDHSEKRAREILDEAVSHYKMDQATLREDRRKDWRRASVAWALAKETSVPHAWIAENLNLKSAAKKRQPADPAFRSGSGEIPPPEGEVVETVTKCCMTRFRCFDREAEKSLPRKVKSWKLSRNVA